MSESKESWNLVLYFPHSHQENLPDHQVKIRRAENSEIFQVKLDDGDVKNINNWTATGSENYIVQLTGKPLKLTTTEKINLKRTKDQYTLKIYKDVYWLLVADPNKYLSNDTLQSTSTYNDALKSTITTLYMSRADQDKTFKIRKDTRIHGKDGKFYGVSDVRPINAIRKLTKYYNSTS